MGLEGFKAMTYQEQLDMKADNAKLKAEVASLKIMTDLAKLAESDFVSFKPVGKVQLGLFGPKLVYNDDHVEELYNGQPVYIKSFDPRRV